MGLQRVRYIGLSCYVLIYANTSALSERRFYAHSHRRTMPIQASQEESYSRRRESRRSAAQARASHRGRGATRETCANGYCVDSCLKVFLDNAVFCSSSDNPLLPHTCFLTRCCVVFFFFFFSFDIQTTMCNLALETFVGHRRAPKWLYSLSASLDHLKVGCRLQE